MLAPEVTKSRAMPHSVLIIIAGAWTLTFKGRRTVGNTSRIRIAGSNPFKPDNKPSQPFKPGQTICLAEGFGELPILFSCLPLREQPTYPSQGKLSLSWT